VLRLDPHSYRAHINFGKTYLSIGKFEDARQLFEQASYLSSRDPIAEGLTAEARALEGDRKGAQRILAALEQRERTAYVAPISLAFAYAGLGRLDAALLSLKKAQKDRTIAALFFRVDPSWEALHDNKDFQELVKDLPDNEEQEQEDAYSTGK
jgi:Flp pilus assembly protein TadD